VLNQRGSAYTPSVLNIHTVRHDIITKCSEELSQL